MAMERTCVFCRQPATGSRVEHILPESLGGKDWATLPPGIVCDPCNQYFGSKVERLALGSFPFLAFRLLLGIPTKRGRSPQMESHLGRLSSGPAGSIHIDAADESTARGIASGEISQVRIPAVPMEPLAVCRMLLKMGIEVIASNSHADALDGRLDAARLFARSPAKGAAWWFMITTDHDRLFRRFLDGVTYADWVDGISMSTVDVEGEDVFHLRLLDMSLITPLRPVFEPAPELAQNEPEWTVHPVIA
jgi:hypothetical protein